MRRGLGWANKVVHAASHVSVTLLLVVCFTGVACNSDDVVEPSHGTSGDSGTSSGTGVASLSDEEGQIQYAEGCYQTVHIGSIIVSTDAELLAYSDVTTVTGGIRISGSVTTLEPLKCVHRVSGSMQVLGASELKSLEGPENLQVVGGLYLYSNPKLETTAGFNAYRVRGGLVIADNQALRELRFDKLERVVTIEIGECAARNPPAGSKTNGNGALTSLDNAFPLLTEGLQLSASGNDSLEAVSSFVEAHGTTFTSGVKFQANAKLDGSALRQTWLDAGFADEDLITCENLDDDNWCDCPAPHY